MLNIADVQLVLSPITTFFRAQRVAASRLHSMHPSSGFASLPAETLRSIRQNIKHLQGLVIFSQICQSTADICNEVFWKQALIVAGFGRPQVVHVELPSTWAGFARIICADSRHFSAVTEGNDGYRYVTEERQWTAWR